ncbi:vitellogenin receptor-like [Oculina patagonica]
MMHWVLLTIVLSIAVIETTDAKPYVRDRKYTENLGKGACANNRYRCEGGNKCIPLKWICDGVHDCDDKLDERNCFTGNETSVPSYINARQIGQAQDILDGTSRSTVSGCPRSTYSCDAGDKCLLLSSLCDGMNDCHDGTDEKNCPLNPVCESNKLSCDDGAKCLPLTWVCDSINDCNDNKDEHNCPNRRTDKSMAHAAEEAAITAAQEAKHAAAAAQELMLQAKRAAEKASRAMKIAEEYKGKKL